MTEDSRLPISSVSEREAGGIPEFELPANKTKDTNLQSILLSSYPDSFFKNFKLQLLYI
jgi:hypothetical protein